MRNTKTQLDASKPVDVYYNLRKKCWSVRQGGIVVLHCRRICLCDVSFVVSEAGRQRVLAERRKNVHAVVRGMVVDEDKTQKDIMYQVRYNPYKGPTFYTDADPVYSAQMVVMYEGKVYATLGG